jgi:hypothetical protein
MIKVDAAAVLIESVGQQPPSRNRVHEEAACLLHVELHGHTETVAA